MIVNGINFQSDSETTPLTKLLNNKECNKEWLLLFFKLSELVNVPIKSQILKKQIQTITNQEWKQLLKSYMNKHYQAS